MNYTTIINDCNFKKVLKNPILDIAARFWEKERYQVFKICYKSMRLIDDLVDNYKIKKGEFSKYDIMQNKSEINMYLEKIISGKLNDHHIYMSLYDEIQKFKIPIWPWKRLIKSMQYDLNNDNFESFTVFLRYCEGAAVSPASIFIHLCGVEKISDMYLEPKFDIRRFARELAIFCYLVHILRDFRDDQMDNLNYFSLDIIKSNGLDVSTLKNIASNKTMTYGFSSLIKQYYNIAEYYRIKARHTINLLSKKIQPRYLLSIEIIYGLYLQIFNKISPQSNNFIIGNLEPTEKEIYNKIIEITNNFQKINLGEI